MAEGYALFSENEIKSIKQDIDTLKKNPLGGTTAGKSLMENIENLNKSINELISIFKEASDQMKIEDKETDIVAKKIDPLFEKIDTLIDQNQKIAKGIVAVADMVSEAIKPQMSAPRPIQVPEPKQISQQPMMPSAMPRTAPPAVPPAPIPPAMPPTMPGLDLPPIGEPGSFPPPKPSAPEFGGLPPLMPPKRESKGLFGIKK